MRIVDLSQLLYPGMPVYPGDGAFSATPRYVFEKDGCNVLDLAMGAHTGTHLDVPRHFVADGATLDMLPLDRFCGTARIVRIPYREGIPLEVPADALEDVRPDDILVLSTGWERRVGSAAYFQDYPRFAADVPERLVRTGIKALALDLPSVKSVGPSRAMHVALLGAGIVVVEGLVNLDHIRSDRFFFSAAPLRIRDGDGSPARAFAIEDGVPA